MSSKTKWMIAVLMLANIIAPATAAPYDKDAEPLKRVPPIMPDLSLTSGYCRLQFDILPNGHTDNIQATECNDNYFKDAAIEGLKKWIYSPAYLNGKPVIRRVMDTRMTFELSDEDGVLVPGPKIPKDDFLYGPTLAKPAKVLRVPTRIRPLKGRVPPRNFCCVEYGVSQTGKPFNVNAHNCTPNILKSDTEYFLRFSKFMPALDGALPASSDGYTSLVYFQFNEERSKMTKQNEKTAIIHKAYYPALASQDDAKYFCSVIS